MRYKTIFIILFGYFLILGCEARRPKAIGNEVGVTVVADSTIYNKIRPVLSAALEREIYTPQPEYLLKLTYLPPEELNRVAVHPNIILAGEIGANDRISQQVRKMLPPGAATQIENEENFVFRKEEPWARKQMLMVLVSTSAEKLREHIEANQDYLFDMLRNRIIKQTKEDMYAKLEQKKIARELLEKHQWKVRVQHDYVVWKEDTVDNFVMLRRTSPERWLFVYWQENAHPDSVSKEWMLRKRDEIGMRYYEQDKVVDRYLRHKETEFAGRPAIQVQGLWENDVKVAGGPFKAYGFYDEDTGRAYIVDVSVFAPGREKEVFLRQLDIIARTFQTAADVNRKS